MSFAVTLVHAPGSLSEPAWDRLRRLAPGAYDHECRFVVHSAAAGHAVTGPQLDTALRHMLAETIGGQAEHLMLSSSGYELTGLGTESEVVHTGMVVLLGAQNHQLDPVRRVPLSLCVDSGPDAGQLIPLRRGKHRIGRARAEVTIADPQLSRLEAALMVGSRDVRLKKSDDEAPVTTAERFTLGSTAFQLVLGPASAPAPQPWPPADSAVDGRAPEGRHTMMLAFALVPLVAGIVLVLVTGLWFFLLFSGASAVIAGSIFVHGHRKRRKYRRALRKAAAEWGERAAQALASPGRAAQLLRGAERTVISAAADGHPAVRLGLGQLEAQLETDSSTKTYRPQMVETAAGISLVAGEATVLTGPRRERVRLLRWVLLQMILSPLPSQVLLVGDSSQLHVPELRDLSRVRSVSTADAALSAPPRAGSGVLLATESLEPQATAHARSAGWHVVMPADEPSFSTSLAGWHVDLGQRTAARLNEPGAGLQVENLRLDGLSDTTLRQLCRLAIPHSVASIGPAELPKQATSRLPNPLFEASAATELLAELGPSQHGTEQLDLVGDGPHVLIAGTTGSGKSELLKTLLLSLCAAHSPQELTMVLVDFKGGSTFQRLAALEQVLGVVTDLSQAAAERTVESIRSELVRREKLFLSVGAGDYLQYRSSTGEPLPRMLVVIDEFRIFAHELPDQLDELMRLATLGRSLGLHLILSTQRPQGVVTADIRANIGTAVALRMRGEDESRDVIGSSAAAEIPRALPGRALLRRPGEPPVELQTAMLQATEPRLQAAPETAGPPAASAPTGDAVEVMCQELAQRRLRRDHTPLLPPLPEHLQAQDSLDHEPGVLLGRVDDPAAQKQYDLRLDPQRPRAFALIGESSAAAGPACRAVTEQLLSADENSAVYLLDGDRSLMGCADHHRVGAWLTEEHMSEAVHLLDQLCDELTARRMGRGRMSQPLVLVLTGYSRWLARSPADLRMEQQLSRLAAEGPQAGISLLLAGGRELAVGKLAGRFQHRIYLPFGSGDDLTYLWPKLRSTEPLAGRGVLIGPTVASPGLTVQLLSPAPITETPAAPPPVTARPEPIIHVRPLPEQLSISDLPHSCQPGVVVGVQQLSWDPVTFQLGPVNLILGSAASGKSSCLRLLNQQLSHARLIRPGTMDLDCVPRVLLIDDAHQCTTAEHHLIQDAVTAGSQVVATAPASAGVFAQLPWAHPARTQGSNVILSPISRSEAESFAAIIPVLEHPVAGRAVHLRPEGAFITQWAFPEES